MTFRALRSWVRFGLTLKLLVPVLGAWLISAGLLFGFFSRQISNQGYDDLRSRLDRQVADKATELSQPLWEMQTDTVLRLMHSYGSDGDLLRVTLTDHNGEVLSSVHGSGQGNPGKALTASQDIRHHSGGESYYLGTIEMAYHDGHLSRQLAERRERDGLALALIMAVLTCAVWGAMHLMVGNPLARLENSLRTNTLPGARRNRLVWQSHDELGKVAGAYNGLLDEVERQTEELQRANRTLQEEVARRAEAEARLRLAAKVFEVSIEAIAIMDPKGFIQTVNDSFERITGYSAPEAEGLHMGELHSSRLSNAFASGLWDGLGKDGFWSGEMWHRRKDGTDYPAWLAISSVLDADQAPLHFVALFHDITQYKEQQQSIEFQAYHDTLTGLPNRTQLEERMLGALAHARRQNSHVAVLFLDLDNFKAVNDSLGHDVGDLLLKTLANRLQSVMRSEDCLARLGGDEFIGLLTDTCAPGDAIQVARRMSEALNKPVTLKGFELQSTASIGIAFYPQDGADPVELVKNADLAMYRAKARGGDTWQFFTQDMDAQAQRRFTLEAKLNKALKREELELHYQPVFSVATGGLLGAEALLRWNCDGAVIQPGEFIPVAEATGAIVPIGEWVVREACSQSVLMAELAGGDFTISVNVSPRQFRHPSFVKSTQDIILDLGVPGGRLAMEITESALIQDLEAAAEKLSQLRAMGIAMWLDDFGTGFSSLMHLKNLPIDGIKIDRSFVSDITENERSRALSASVVHIAGGIGVGVVAEGVETRQQLLALEAMGCGSFQGFLESRPITAEDFLLYMAKLAESGRLPGQSSGKWSRLDLGQKPGHMANQNGVSAA